MRRKEEVDSTRKRRPKKGHENHVKQDPKNVCDAQIPANDPYVYKTKNGCREANGEGGKKGRNVIRKGKRRARNGRNGQVADGAVCLVLHDEKIGAKGDRHARNGEDRGDQLSSHKAPDKLLGDDDALGNAREKGVSKDVAEKGRVQNEQDHRGDESRKEHPLILEKQLGVA